MKLTSGKRKTAWVGLICSARSIIGLATHLLTRPQKRFQYFLTYKLSQDHLEMLFSRIRRRGGWNNNPNCLQLKWALRAVLMKNGITPSKNANCTDITMETPSNMVFQRVPSVAAMESERKMQQFAELLTKPTVWHDQVLHYMAGYIARHIVKVIIRFIQTFMNITTQADKVFSIISTSVSSQILHTCTCHREPSNPNFVASGVISHIERI